MGLGTSKNVSIKQLKNYLNKRPPPTQKSINRAPIPTSRTIKRKHINNPRRIQKVYLNLHQLNWMNLKRAKWQKKTVNRKYLV